MKKNIIKTLAIGALSLLSISVLTGCSMDTHHYYGEGKSAYQVAVDNGFEGTEEEWLESLVGHQGEKGDQGIQGEAGIQGEKGNDGISIENVQISYEVDENGNLYMVFTFLYNNDTSNIVKSLVPQVATTTDDLISALASGETVMLATDISTTEYIIMNGGNFDGNGNTIDGENITARIDCALTSTGGIIENVTIINAPRGLGTGSSGVYSLSEDLIINNVYIDGGTYAINVSGGNGYKMSVSNSTLYGWTSYAGLSLAEFTNCMFGQGETNYAYIRAHDSTSFNNCKFEDGFKIGVASEGMVENEEFTVTLENCYYGDTLITAENFVSLLTVEGDEDTDTLKLCTVTVDGISVTW